MLSLVLLISAAATSSPDGRFQFTIKEHDEHAVVLVQGPTGGVVGRLALRAHNLEARFVAGNNLLVTWSCGAPCEAAVLITPRGTQLASLTFPVVSADGRFALDLNVVNLDPGDVAVSVVDLRTGKRSSGKPVVYPGLFQCTEAADAVTEFVYSGCRGGRVIHVRF